MAYCFSQLLHGGQWIIIKNYPFSKQRALQMRGIRKLCIEWNRELEIYSKRRGIRKTKNKRR